MGRPLSQSARQKAIDAAQALVAELGITGFTLDGVARRSGVAKTTLYRHWRNGTALLTHALGCVIEQTPTPDTGSLRGDLTELLTFGCSWVSAPFRRRLFLELATAAARDPDLAALGRSLTHDRTRPIRQVLHQAVERGEIPPPADVALACRLIEGPVASQLVEPGEPWTTDQIATLVELLARALGAHPTDPHP